MCQRVYLKYLYRYFNVKIFNNCEILYNMQDTTAPLVYLALCPLLRHLTWEPLDERCAVHVNLFIIIILQELGLDRPLYASSNSPFERSSISSSSMQSIIVHFLFCILLLIPLGCHSQSYIYLLRLSLTGFTFNSSKVSSHFLWSKRVYKF